MNATDKTTRATSSGDRTPEACGADRVSLSARARTSLDGIQAKRRYISRMKASELPAELARRRAAGALREEDGGGEEGARRQESGRGYQGAVVVIVPEGCTGPWGPRVSG